MECKDLIKKKPLEQRTFSPFFQLLLVSSKRVNCQYRCDGKGREKKEHRHPSQVVGER